MIKMMKNRPAQSVFALFALFALLLALALTACSNKVVKIGNLYQRLGGEEAVAKIAQSSWTNVQGDPRIRDRFKKVDGDRLKTLLAEQICVIGGGPCSYTGRSMSVAHEGMKITNIEFDAFIGDVAKALDQHQVEPAEQRELLFALKAMRGEVMGITD